MHAATLEAFYRTAAPAARTNMHKMIAHRYGLQFADRLHQKITEEERARRALEKMKEARP